VVSTPWERMVASTGSGLGSRANGSRPPGPATSRSARGNAVPSGSRSRKQEPSSGRREPGASYTPRSPPRGRYEEKGSGALIWIGERPVKASTAGRDCSMATLRDRLGDFETALVPPARASIPARAVDESTPTLRVYLDERREDYRERESRRARATREQRGEWRDLADRHRKERADIFRGSWRGKGDLLNATRSVLAARQAQDKAAVRERHQLERAALRREQARFPAYEDWLARRDRDQADRWRHRDRRPATIEGATFEQPTARDIRAFTAVLDGRKVHSHLAGSRRAAFTDHGKTINIHASRNRESVLAALQLSAQKWGTISVHGNRDFMRICVELAAEHGFTIANPDLQEAIAAQRQRIRLPNGPDTRAPDVGPRPESLALASIYRRHIDEIVRDQPGARRTDASRLVAEVAIRLAVTGHSRGQIGAAILEGARTDRPDEDRDWQAYIQRAVQHAFGPSGEQARRHLEPLRDKLVRIEGGDERHLLRRLRGPFRGF
jgi:Large polyvalent protein-associated domain 7/RepB DNA-primase C-terminal helical domain